MASSTEGITYFQVSATVLDEIGAANTLTDAQKSRPNTLDNTINDHLGEMKDSYKSLQKTKGGLDKANSYITEIEKMFELFGGINQ